MTQEITQVYEKNVQVPRSVATAPIMDSLQVFPAAEGLFPGLLLIHEIVGLNENIREIARMFGRAGYAALAVDLFSGVKRSLCLMQIFHGILIKPLDNPVLADLQSAMDFWRKQPGVDPNRIGVVGFCSGGAYALQMAITDQQIHAASVFYAMNPRLLEKIALSCPIIGSYPGNDYTTADARKLQAILDQNQIPNDIKIYPGTFHSFFNDRGITFQPQAAADAWNRMMAFFDIHLRKTDQPE